MSVASTHSRSWLWASAAIALAVGVGAVTYWMQPREAATDPAIIPATAPTSRPATLAVIVREARDLKLITWSFETTVDAQSVSDKWYGDAVATVRAPVKYQYGIDLATLEEGSIFRDANTGQMMFIVHAPQRLSVEIDLERLEESLQTSGLRWKSRNQSQLDDTRSRLGAIAKGLELSKRDDARMKEISREQIERHLSQVLSRIEPGVVVGVKFGE